MIQQHCFTYTKKGAFRPSEGYDTTAYSSGLDEGFIKERIHPLCFYKPSKALETSGTLEEAFPKAITLAHFPAGVTGAEGATLLGQTVYKAPESAGQRSAFFTHNYIFPPEYRQNIIANIHNVLYNVFFLTDRDTNSLEPLKELPLIVSSRSVSVPKENRRYGTVWRDFFYAEKEKLLQMIFALIQAVQAVSSGKKVYVVLSADARVLIEWLYEYLPPAVTAKLGFTTYSRDPESKKFLHLIFMEVLRPDALSGAHDYIFDFESGRFSAGLPEIDDSPFLQRIWQCFSTGAGGKTLRTFYDFAARFPHSSALQHWNDLVDLFDICTDSARLPSYDSEMKRHIIKVLCRFLPHAPEILTPLTLKIALEESDAIAGSFADSTAAEVFEELAFWHNILAGQKELALTTEPNLTKYAAKRLAGIMAAADEPIAAASEMYRLAKNYRSKISGMPLLTAITAGLLERLDFDNLTIEQLQKIPEDFTLCGKKMQKPVPYMLVEILSKISDYLLHPIIEHVDFRELFSKYPLEAADTVYLKAMLKKFMTAHITPSRFENTAYLFDESETDELLHYIENYAGTRKGAFLVWAVDAGKINLQLEPHAEAARSIIRNNLKDGDFKALIYKSEPLKGLAREVRFGRIIGRV